VVEVSYLGHASFKLSGKDISIVCDPFSEKMVGRKFPRVEADVVTVSHDHPDHAEKGAVRGDFVCFDSPGEYEIKGSEIVGIKSFHDNQEGAIRGQNTIFIYDIDGLRFCHLGDLGHELGGEQIEKIDGIDVLFIPVGGHFTIDAKIASKVISSIGPRIVVPMHYAGNKIEGLDPVEGFLKEIGKEPRRVSELKVKKKELPENLEVYVLSPKAK